MPLNKSGNVWYDLSKWPTAQAALQGKIQEMRGELRRIESVLSTIEMHTRKPFEADTKGEGAPALHGALKPQFSLLFNWYLSAMESFIAMSWLVFGRETTRLVVLDFARRFQGWNKL